MKLSPLLLASVLNLVTGFAGAQTLKEGVFAKVTPTLEQLHTRYSAHQLSRAPGRFVANEPSMVVADDQVVVDAVASSDPEELKRDLMSMGMQRITTFGRVISGALPIASIPAVSTLASLQFARAAEATTRSGVVTSQGDQAMRSDIARSTFGVNGAGVTVGVLSDSFNCLGGAASDVATGDLTPVNVVSEISSCSGATDEGRAMLQIVHDIAPGASLSFASAFNGQAAFASNIQALAAAGAKVIVDDVVYFAEPFFQDGIIAQAVNSVVAAGAAYFSAAGNEARQAYESAFNPGDVFNDGAIPSGPSAPHFFGGRAHNFNPSGAKDHFQSLTIPARATVRFILQWDSPFFSVSGAPGTQNDLDIYILNSSATQVLAGSAFNNIGGDAVEIFAFTNNANTPVNVNLMIVNFSGANPGFIKYIWFGSATINEYDTRSGTVFGHANAGGAEAVGAAAYPNTPRFGVSPPLVESFSSSGTTSVFFNTAGGRLATPEIRPKPEVVAPDGVDTTFFGSDTDRDGFPNFFGTSAAAPHAAGVAALLWQAHPNSSSVEIYNMLEQTTVDMATPGFDTGTGFGLIQADAALGTNSLMHVEYTEGQAQYADLNGDGKADLIFQGLDNHFWVSLSTGGGFTAPAVWVSHGWSFVKGQAQYVDLNGDGKADLIFQGLDNHFWVSLSTGTGFTAPALWLVLNGVFVEGQAQYADVNGDGKADLIFQDFNNRFWVSLSTGAGFTAPALWVVHGGLFVQGQAQYADLNGDGKADLIFEGLDNHFWASLSTGSAFTPPALWLVHGGLFLRGEAQYADLNADGKADLIFQGFDNKFWVSLSTGAGFTAPALWVVHGGSFARGEAQYADLNGDGKADLIFQGLDNHFWVSLSTGSGFTAPAVWVSHGWSFVKGQAQYADLNGDGKADLIFQGLDNHFWISFSIGSGFTAPGSSLTHGGFAQGQAQYVDVDGDGKADLVYENLDNQFSVLASRGTGFSAPDIWVVHGGPFIKGAAQYADLDGDGKNDLILRWLDNHFWVSLSTGSGFTAPALWLVHGGAFTDGQARYADLNGDGKADVIFQDSSNQFWVSLSTGTGFTAPALWVSHGWSFIKGEAQYADVNGDGKADLIFQGLDNQFWVSLSTGSGFTAPAVWLALGGGFVEGQVQYADVNGDGKADLIFQGLDNSFWVSLSTGSGFTAPVLWVVHPAPFVAGQAQYADLNGDGRADLIFQGLDNRFWVSLSTGNGFTAPVVWVAHGGSFLQGQAQYTDVNGDHQADLIFQVDTVFWVSLSTGTGFTPPQRWF